ncbi:hypothetical protein AEM38_02845 [Hyphomonadaceae bacterium UKL13-1]|nr:hypothetical protein AEM38_02845 [Hyphomonadaceae bacterium UKL13-1]
MLHDASDFAAPDIQLKDQSRSSHLIRQVGMGLQARLQALDAIHAAILDPVLIPWAEDCLQSWLQSGLVVLKLGLIQKKRHPSSSEAGEVLFAPPNVKRRTGIASIFVTTPKHFALCFIQEVEADSEQDRPNLDAIERQLQSSLNSISSVIALVANEKAQLAQGQKNHLADHNPI